MGVDSIVTLCICGTRSCIFFRLMKTSAHMQLQLALLVGSDEGRWETVFALDGSSDVLSGLNGEFEELQLALLVG